MGRSNADKIAAAEKKAASSAAKGKKKASDQEGQEMFKETRVEVQGLEKLRKHQRFCMFISVHIFYLI